jgi:hypothetical protein
MTFWRKLREFAYDWISASMRTLLPMLVFGNIIVAI